VGRVGGELTTYIKVRGVSFLTGEMAKLYLFVRFFMKRWFVLFVQTGKEKEIADKLSPLLEHVSTHPIVPRKEQVFKKMGKSIREERISFPGYVFLQSELSGKEFIRTSYQAVKKLKGVYKLLNYGSFEDIEVSEGESYILWRLCCDGLIELSAGVIEGDKVRITSGPLSGIESIIHKINRHKREAIVEIPLFGHTHTMALPLEIVSKC